jgi:hypothetical protein
VEGNLTQEQEAQLEEFILNNPELELELDSWQAAKVDPVTFEFPNQESLYRNEKRKRRILPYYIGVAMGFVVLLLTLNWKNHPEVKLADNAKINTPQKVLANKVSNLTSEITSSKSSQKTEAIDNRASISRKNQEYSISAKKSPILTVNQNPNSSENYNTDVQKIQIDLKSNITPMIMDKANNNIAENQEDTNLSIDLTANIIQSEEKIQVSIDSMETKITEVKENKNTFNKPKKSNNNEEMKSLSIGKMISKLNDYMGNEIGLKNTRDHQMHVPGISQLDANFSSAGDVSSMRFRSMSRAQWINNENQLFSNQLSLDWYSKSLKSGFGIQGNYKYYGNGVIQDWNTAIIYSPKILVSKSLLIEPGVRFKMGNKLLNDSKVTGVSQVELERNNSLDFYADGSLPIGNQLWYRDLGVSILLHSRWFYLGGQIDNLLRHNDNIYSNNISNPRRIRNHIAIKAGTDYESKSGKLSLSPYIYYEKFENREETWAGLNFQYKTWAVGGAISTKKNLAVSTGLRFSKFAVTYQFDRTYSNLIGQILSSHQLGITINSKVSRSPRRYIRLK